jgi:hypothetical protein
MVQRFLTGQRDIRLATADAIAAALGLRLVEVGRGRGRPRPTPMAAVSAPGPVDDIAGGGCPEATEPLATGQDA